MTDIRAKRIWHNGALIDWDDARIHVVSHALHYGTCWFEGIRCYHTRQGPAVFRLQEHVDRLFHSCKIYRTPIGYLPQQIFDAILSTIAVNGFQECYIRPLVLRGQWAVGVDPREASVEVYIPTWQWGKYLGQEAMEKGVRACVSTWSRTAPNTYPTMAKTAGNYLTGVLAKMEASINGYGEGIALDDRGLVSEGSGQNLFVVKDRVIFTPQLDHSILPGITRRSVIQLASDLGIQVREAAVPREMLYIADELFFTGTAAEVTPIRSVDDIPVGQGAKGPVTDALQKAFFGIVEGLAPDSHGWLTPVPPLDLSSGSP